MKVLKLNDAGVKQALKHEVLQGLPLIGRGSFSTVYDKGDTVIHLTLDPVTYAMHCDGICAVQGPHFSRVVNDWGWIGEQRDGDLNVHLFETEKLVPLRGQLEARRLANRIISISTYYAANPDVVLDKIASDVSLPGSIREALEALVDFCPNWEKARLDMHPGNFMVRPSTGELIFNDILCDGSIYGDAARRLTAKYNRAAA